MLYHCGMLYQSTLESVGVIFLYCSSCYAITYVCLSPKYGMFYCTLIILPMFYQKAESCFTDYSSLGISTF